VREKHCFSCAGVRIGWVVWMALKKAGSGSSPDQWLLPCAGEYLENDKKGMFTGFTQ